MALSTLVTHDDDDDDDVDVDDIAGLFPEAWYRT